MHSTSAGQEPARTPVHILSVPRTGYIIVAIAGPIRGLMMHWRAGGSVPCLPEPDCPASIHRSGCIWKGYAPCRQWDHGLGAWKPYALEVTEALEETLRGRDLPGEIWRLSRVRLKKRAGSVHGILEERREDAALRVAFDVRAIIERRYHCGPLVWDVPNPVVPKLLLPLTDGAPPSSIPIIHLYTTDRPTAPVDPALQGLSSWERVTRIGAKEQADAGANGVDDRH
jgi:hypothetical protein